MFSLTNEDFDKIRQGYGCPRCLEDYQGIWRQVCPVCKHKAEIADFIDQAKMPWMQVADPDLA